MTKREMAIVVLSTLLNVTEEKAEKLAGNAHGEFVALMKKKKFDLEAMFYLASIIKLGKYHQNKN